MMPKPGKTLELHSAYDPYFNNIIQSNGGETEFPRFYQRKVICCGDKR